MRKEVLKIGKRLIRSYNKGLISYPRVSNDYIKSPSFFSPTHVKFEAFNKYATGLNCKTYPLNKKTAILELTNAEILTPSTIENVFQTIDVYFDDELNVRKEMEEKVSMLLNSFEDYLNIRKGRIGVNDLCKDGRVSCPIPTVYMFRIELSPSTQRNTEKNYSYVSKKEKASNFSKAAQFKKANSLDEIVTMFNKRKRIRELDFRPEENHKKHRKIIDQNNDCLANKHKHF